MLSESARMSSAAEARFRVAEAAAVARAIRVFALDPPSDALVARLAKGAWHRVAFLPASAVAEGATAWEHEIAGADLVVMVVHAGADARAAARIGRACSDRRIHTATFLIRGASTTDETLSKTLGQIRPWSLMVVVAGDESYVEDILRSFR